jgi:type I restriction enzyme S subunit
MERETSNFKIGDLFELVNGYAFKSGEFIKSGIPVIKIKNVKAGRMLYETLSYVDPRFLHSRSDKVIQKGDLLITMSGNRLDGSPETWVGKVAQFDKNTPYLLNQRVGILRPKKGVELDRRFFSYSLSSDFYQKEFISIATSSGGQANLSPTQILSAPIDVPSLPDQKRIAHILGTLDDKMELNRRMNATLESMARALFRSWFVDFDPVKRNAEASASRPEDSMFPDSFETSSLGDIPFGWNVTTLGNVLDVLETGRRPKGGVAGYSSGIPSIGAESIWGIGKFDYSKTKYVPTEFYEKTSAGRVEHNDVLLYKDGGKPGEFRPRVGLFGHGFPFEKFSINEHVFRMRSGSVGQIFLYFAVSDQRVLDDFANKGGKAAIPGINQVDVRSTRILMPDKRVLEEFNRQVTPWCDLMIQKAIQSRTLANLRDALLPKLLSGELAIDQPFQGKEGIAVCQ